MSREQNNQPTSQQTREALMADFQITTSESPDVIRRALEAEGATDADSEGNSELDGDDAIAAASGDGSDPSEEAAADGDDGDTDGADDADGVDDDDDTDESTRETAGKDGKGKQKSGINKKFASLTRKLAASNQANADLMKRLEALEKKPAAEPAKETKTEATAEAAVEKVEKFSAKPAPTPEDKDAHGKDLYPTYGDFVAALAKWTKEVTDDAQTHAEKRAAKIAKDAVGELKKEWEAERKKEVEARAKSDAEAEGKKLIDAYNGRRDKVAAKFPVDFKKFVVENVNKIQLTPAMSDIILTHDLGPNIALYLGRNPKEAQAIGGQTVQQQLVSMGRIIAKLEAVASKTTKTDNTNVGTGKRKPNEPLPRGSQAGGRGSGGPMTYRRAETMSADDYIAQRRAGTIK
jgi:hypothetical protein